jgi:hypothetical protein
MWAVYDGSPQCGADDAASIMIFEWNVMQDMAHSAFSWKLGFTDTL